MTTRVSIAAAVIAGGFSRRMGRDKALLSADGHATLLERQIAILRTISPAEILVSCRAEQSLPLPPAVRRVHDDGTRGPLVGIGNVLEAITTDFVFVLAVDLARITPALVQRIVARSRTATGIVPRGAHGVEPLASLLPRSFAVIVREMLAAGHDLSLHRAMEAGVAAGLLSWFDLPEDDNEQFENWNHPATTPRA